MRAPNKPYEGIFTEPRLESPERSEGASVQGIGLSQSKFPHPLLSKFPDSLCFLFKPLCSLSLSIGLKDRVNSTLRLIFIIFRHLRTPLLLILLYSIFTMEFNPYALKESLARAYMGFIGTDWTKPCPEGYALELEPGTYVRCSDYDQYLKLLEGKHAYFTSYEYHLCN